MPRLSPFASSDAKAIDEAIASIAQHDYAAFHNIVLVNGRVDHVVVGPSGVYALATHRVRLSREAARRRAYDASVLVRRQLAAAGTAIKVWPVVVPMISSERKEISELSGSAVVEIGSLAFWLKGRTLKLEPLVLEAVKAALTPLTGDALP